MHAYDRGKKAKKVLRCGFFFKHIDIPYRHVKWNENPIRCLKNDRAHRKKVNGERDECVRSIPNIFLFFFRFCLLLFMRVGHHVMNLVLQLLSVFFSSRLSLSFRCSISLSAQVPFVTRLENGWNSAFGTVFVCVYIIYRLNALYLTLMWKNEKQPNRAHRAREANNFDEASVWWVQKFVEMPMEWVWASQWELVQFEA